MIHQTKHILRFQSPRKKLLDIIFCTKLDIHVNDNDQASPIMYLLLKMFKTPFVQDLLFVLKFVVLNNNLVLFQKYLKWSINNPKQNFHKKILIHLTISDIIFSKYFLSHSLTREATCEANFIILDIKFFFTCGELNLQKAP